MDKFKYISRPKLRLSEVERIIRVQRIIVPCPSRSTLIGFCEDGTFETVSKDENGYPTKTGFCWLIFEDSFWNWVKKMDGVQETV